jgi:replicative DNA helicase
MTAEAKLRRRRQHPFDGQPLGRVPNDPDMEAAALGCIILDAAARSEGLDILRDDHFHSPGHRKILEAVRYLAGRGTAIDLITVTTALREAGRLEEVGGAAYVTAILDRVTAPANKMRFCLNSHIFAMCVRD